MAHPIYSNEEWLKLCPTGRRFPPDAIDQVTFMLLQHHCTTGDMQSLELGIINAREDLELCPPEHSERAFSLRLVLGTLLNQKSWATGDVAAVEEALCHAKEALNVCALGHPYHAESLAFLGISLIIHCRWTGDIQSLDGAIKLYEESYQLCASRDDERAPVLGTLLNVLVWKAIMMHDVSPLTVAVKHAETLVADPAIPPTIRLDMVTNFLSFVLRIFRDHLKKLSPVLRALLRLSNAAVQLPARMLYLDPQARLVQLLRLKGLGPSFAVIALSIDNPRKAVELLEETRTVFWSQALRLRTPLDDLPPADAVKLDQLFRQLETPIAADQPDRGDANTALQRFQRQATQDDIDSLIGLIRQRPRFDRFLLPLTYMALSQAATKGPVVVLLAHPVYCEAIVIMDPVETILRVPLCELPFDEVERLVAKVNDNNLRLGESLTSSSDDQAVGLLQQRDTVSGNEDTLFLSHDLIKLLTDGNPFGRRYRLQENERNSPKRCY